MALAQNHGNERGLRDFAQALANLVARAAEAVRCALAAPEQASSAAVQLLWAVVKQLALPVACDVLIQVVEQGRFKGNNIHEIIAELKQRLVNLAVKLRRQLTWLLPAACAVALVTATAAAAPTSLAVALELVEPCLTFMPVQQIPWRFYIALGVPNALHQMAREGAVDGAGLRNLLGIQPVQQDAQQQQKAAERKQLDDMLDWVMGRCE